MAELVFSNDLETEVREDSFQAVPDTATSDLLSNMNNTVRSFNADRESAMDMAWVKAATGKLTNPVDEYQNILSRLQAGEALTDVQDEIKLNHMVQLENDVSNGLSSMLTSENPEDRELAASFLRDGRGAISDLQAEYLESTGLERMKAELIGTKNVEELEVRREIVRQTANRLVSEALDERGIVGTTFDFFEAALPLNFTLDLNDMFNTVYGGQDKFIAFALRFQQLDPAQQEEVFPTVVLPAIMDASDNNNAFAARAITEMLFNPNVIFDVILSSSLDILGVGELAKLGVGSVKYLKNIKEAGMLSGSKAKDIDNLANKSAASGTVDVARRTEDGSPVGMGRMDLARSADPMDTTIISRLPVESGSDFLQLAKKAPAARMVENLVSGAVDPVRKQLRLQAIKDIRKANVELEQARGVLGLVSARLKTVRTGKELKTLGTLSKTAKMRISEIERSLAQTRSLLDEVKLPSVSPATVRLQRGEIPDQLRPQIEDMVEQAIVKTVAGRTGQGKARAEAIRAKVNAEHSGVEGIATATLERAGVGKVLDNIETSQLTEEFADDLANAVALNVRTLGKEIEEQAPQILTEKQKGVIRDRIVDDIQKRASIGGQEVSFGEALITKEGVNVRYTMDGVEDSFTHNWTLDDTGLLQSAGEPIPQLASKLKKFLSPENVITFFKESIVRDAKFAQDQGSRAANELLKLYKGIDKGMTKNQLAEADILLKAGDEEARIFGARDLLDGLVEVKGAKKKYDTAVVRNYFRKRAFYDEMHSLRNFTTKRQLELTGMRNISFRTKEGQTVNLLGNEVDSSRVVLDDTALVFNANSVGDKTSEFVMARSARDLAKTGHKFVRLLEPKKVDSQKIKFAIVRDDDIAGVKIGGLPAQVLNYKDGYIPRIYRPGYWFVKSEGDNATLFAAETKAIADKWSKKATEEATDGTKYATHSDREFDPTEALVEGSNGFGGLYTGSRKQTPLMVRAGDDALSKPATASVNDSTERYIQNIATTMSMGEYRLGMVREWENTVKDILKASNKDLKASKLTFNSETTGITDAKLNGEMLHLRDYIRRVGGIPTNEEKQTATVLNRIADKMYGIDLLKGNARDLTLNAIGLSPVRALKAQTFGLHLGWFNPRQLFIQAQNAAIAVSVSPLQAPRAFLKTLAMRAAVLSDDPAVWKQTGDFIPGFDTEDFVRNVADFRKSGLKDGIIKQGDLEGDAVGIANASIKRLRNASAAGRVFFTEGELGARLMAWNIARQINPKSSIRELSDETTRLLMDMSSANAAVWQTNLLSIPTQFLQVQAKFAENIVKGIVAGGEGRISKAAQKQLGKPRWTRVEAAKILVGQIALYGTVGVPVAQDAASYLAELTGSDPVTYARENPTVIEAIEEGMLGVLTQTLGFENNFSSSSSLVQGMFADNAVYNAMEFMSDMIIDQQTDVDVASLFGANKNTVSRGVDVFQQINKNMRIMWTVPSVDNMTYAIAETANSIAAMTSTWSNIERTFFAYQLGLQSKKGTLQIGKEEFQAMSAQTLITRAMGITTDVESTYWTTKKFNMSFDKKKQRFSRDWKQTLINYTKHGDLDRLKSEQAALSVMFTPFEHREFLHTMNRSITKEAKNDFDKEVQRAYQNIMMLEDGRLPPSLLNKEAN